MRLALRVRLELLALRVRLAPRAIQATPEPSGLLVQREPRGRKEMLALLVPKELLARLAQPEPLEPWVRPVPLDHRDLKARQAQRVRKETWGPLALRGHKATPDPLGLPAQPARQVHRAFRELRVRRGQRVRLV